MPVHRVAATPDSGSIACSEADAPGLLTSKGCWICACAQLLNIVVERLIISTAALEFFIEILLKANILKDIMSEANHFIMANNNPLRDKYLEGQAV